MSAIEKIYN